MRYCTAAVMTLLFLSCVSIPRGQKAEATTFADSFEDGVIDGSLWTTGGWRWGVDGLGNGSYAWSHIEVTGADGYLDMSIQGPQSANTYGAYAYVQSRYDYNDKQNHLINFTWGADVNDRHVDFYAIQVSPGLVPNNDYTWLGYSSGNLYFSNGSLAGPAYPNGWGGRGQTDLPATTWSATINGQTNSASLYSGSNATGTLIGTINLDPNAHWYFSFILGDGTSAGYPSTDNSLFLYSYESTSSSAPEPASLTLLFALMGGGGLAGRIRSYAERK